MRSLTLRPLSRKTWYRIALFLPFVLPCLVWIIETILLSRFSFVRPDGSRGMIQVSLEFLNAAFFYLHSAVLFGGIQYLAFAVCLIWWGRHKTADQFQRPMLLLPILFLPICGVGDALLSSFHDGFNSQVFAASLPASFFIAMFALPIGYFYIAVVLVVTYLLQKAGWVKG